MAVMYLQVPDLLVWSDTYQPAQSQKKARNLKAEMCLCFLIYAKNLLLSMCDSHIIAGYQIDESKVLGGEACLWAEYIDNENLMSTLW